MLRVKNLYFSYSSGFTLNNINLTVHSGKITGLLGANGSGKTTVLKCINGMLARDRGEVYFGDKKLSDLNPRQTAQLISLVPQEHTASFSYRVLDIVTMGVTPYISFGGVPAPEDFDRAEEILASMGIGGLAGRSYNSLSGGQKQLVLIARSVMQATDYLIFDEPSSHLDFKNRYLLAREISELASRGKGIIMALHDPNFARKLCDNIVILKKGRVLVRGEAEDIINRTNLQEAYEIGVDVDERTGLVEVMG